MSATACQCAICDTPTPAEWIERHASELEPLRGSWVVVDASGLVDHDPSAAALRARNPPKAGQGYYFVPPEGAPAFSTTGKEP